MCNSTEVADCLLIIVTMIISVTLLHLFCKKSGDKNKKVKMVTKEWREV